MYFFGLSRVVYRQIKFCLLFFGLGILLLNLYDVYSTSLGLNSGVCYEMNVLPFNVPVKLGLVALFSLVSFFIWKKSNREKDGALKRRVMLAFFVFVFAFYVVVAVNNTFVLLR